MSIVNDLEEFNKKLLTMSAEEKLAELDRLIEKDHSENFDERAYILFKNLYPKSKIDLEKFKKIVLTNQ